MPPVPPRLIDLEAVLTKRLPPALVPLVRAPAERLLAVPALNDIYAGVAADLAEQVDAEPWAFWDAGLRLVGAEYRVAEQDLAHIPETGPVIVVANHPFGGIDGLILGAILARRRPDTRLMANFLLGQMPEIRQHIIPVDPFGTGDSRARNARPLREALACLKQGGLVGVFPAGEVATWRWANRQIVEKAWSSQIGALARRTGATVVPLFFEGRNSALFHLAGLIHDRLRTALLIRELLNKQGGHFEVRIGRPLSPKRLAACADNAEATALMRLKTLVLAERTPVDARKLQRFPRLPGFRPRREEAEPLAEAEPPDRLAGEVAALPEEACLLKHGAYAVYLAEAPAMPACLREIGRLRELTFRAVKEGTGAARDLDAFDAHYLHLFLWNRERREIGGAYRLGLTDRILADQGPDGLYTTTLFRLKPALLEAIQPGIELGRSFIRPEYQRKHTSLALIWRGIGAFLYRNPRYQYLFGPVSMSAAYNALSRDLIVQFLQDTSLHPRWAGWVKAKHPPRLRYRRSPEGATARTALRDIEDVSAIVSEIEQDRKGVPILLKHYLKLNGVLLSFNVDEEFSDVIDGLILVDLDRTDPAIIKKYMGPEAYAEYAAQRRGVDSA
ncbi:MAG: lysophospholipid acyltransferase family protein [Opitutales bacterium]